MLQNLKSMLTEQQMKQMEGLCFQPLIINYDFSHQKGEREVVKAYIGQLGKTKNHKFKVYSKQS